MSCVTVGQVRLCEASNGALCYGMVSLGRLGMARSDKVCHRMARCVATGLEIKKRRNNTWNL